MVEVRWRVIEAERHTGALCCRGELRHDVFAIRSPGDLVFGVGRVEHAEAVVVFGGEDHVLLACSASQIDEGLRVELSWIEALWERAVLRFSNAARLGSHDGPGRLDAGQRGRPPVDEHAEFGVAVPGRAVILKYGSKCRLGDER